MPPLLAVSLAKREVPVRAYCRFARRKRTRLTNSEYAEECEWLMAICVIIPIMITYHVIFGAYGFWLPNDPRGSYSDFVYSEPLRQFGPATKSLLATGSARRIGSNAQIYQPESVANVAHDINLRLAAKEALKYPAVKFTGIQARAVGRGFSRVVRDTQLQIYACAIMPDHVHLVIGVYADNRVARDTRTAGKRPSATHAPQADAVIADNHVARDTRTADGRPSATHSPQADAVIETGRVKKIVGQLKACATMCLNKENIHPLNGEHTPWARGCWNVFLDTEEHVQRAIKYVEDNPLKEGLPPQKWTFVVPYR